MNPPLRRAVAIAAALASALTLALVAPAPASADIAADEARALVLLNAARAAAGAPALRVDPLLSAAAHQWAAGQAAADTLLHNRQLGSQVAASKLGEIMTRGNTVDAAHNALMASAAHRRTMLDPGFNSVGVGVAYFNGMVVLVEDYALMATPTGSPQPAPAPPPPPPPPPTTLPPPPPPPTTTVTKPPPLPPATVAPVVRVAPTLPPPTVAPAPVARPAVASNQGSPLAPAALAASRTQVSARYADSQGQPGRVYFWVLDAGGRIAAQGLIGPVCSGCTATMALPPLAPGAYRLYAFSTDGATSPVTGPVTFII